MFTGVLEDHTAFKKTLLGIRAELSITAAILCIGHIVKYGDSYLSQVLDPLITMPFVRIAATLVALILVLLLIPLSITSVKKVREAMGLKSWKKLQKLSYVFYGLIFIHIMFYLVPSALNGSVTAIGSVLIYAILGLIYVILRIRLCKISQSALSC
jgi:DMSO/TMAO reductase YedYZ heme-binding membrane subunit